MKNKKLLILALVVMLMVSLMGCGKSQILSLKVNKNEKYRITTTTNLKMVISFADKNNSSKIIIPDVQTSEDITESYICNIADVDKDGNVTIKAKYDYIVSEVTGLGKAVKIDTRDESCKNTDEGKMCSEIIKNEFTVKINKAGKVLSINGVNDMIDKIINSYGLTSTQKESFASLIKQNYGDEAIKESFNRMTDIYPKEEIKTGLTWKTEQKDSQGIPRTISTSWKIKDITDGFVTAETDSNVTCNTDNNSLDIMGMKMKANLKGNSKGTVKISMDNGLMQSGEFNEKASGTMEMTISNLGNEQNGSMLMPVNIESTVKYHTEKIK